MNPTNFHISALIRMAHSPVHNYVLPGLTSYLIGEPSPKGTMRLFRASRTQQGSITPHSHRFDFMCWVLQGWVINRIWEQADADYLDADPYLTTTLTYGGEMGAYTATPGEVSRWRTKDQPVNAGACYHMRADQVHSIAFSRDALVLFFEGPTLTDRSIALEPVVNGETLHTLEVKPWMFRRGSM